MNDKNNSHIALLSMQGGFSLSLLSKTDLENIKRNYNSNDLVDIHDIKVEDGTIEEILNNFFMKVKNPYHFKSNNVEVEISYNDTSDKIISDLLKDYFLREK